MGRLGDAEGRLRGRLMSVKRSLSSPSAESAPVLRHPLAAVPPFVQEPDLARFQRRRSGTVARARADLRDAARRVHVVSPRAAPTPRYLDLAPLPRTHTHPS